MNVAPVSGDLLVKLGLVAAAGLGAWLLLERARNSLPAFPTPDWSMVNPASDQNLIYRGTSGVVSVITGRDETLGGWIYDLTHADPVATPAASVPDLTVTEEHAYDAMGNQIY